MKDSISFDISDWKKSGQWLALVDNELHIYFVCRADMANSLRGITGIGGIHADIIWLYANRRILVIQPEIGKFLKDWPLQTSKLTFDNESIWLDRGVFYINPGISVKDIFMESEGKG